MEIDKLHSPEAEQAILGYVMHDNSFLRHVPSLRDEHFYNPIHRRIFAVCVSMINAGALVDAITLKNRFAQDDTLADIGGVEYICLLYTSPSPRDRG